MKGDEGEATESEAVAAAEPEPEPEPEPEAEGEAEKDIDGTMSCPSAKKVFLKEPEINRHIPKNRSMINKFKNAGRSLKNKTTGLFSSKPKTVTHRMPEKNF